MSDATKWRVGEFTSSSNPQKTVLMLAVGSDIEAHEKHHSFIRWVDSTPSAPAVDVGCWDATAPAEPRALRMSVAECDALSNTDDRGILVSESESIALVLHELTRLQAVTKTAEHFDMLGHLARQREWSTRTFGPGSRAKGVVDHIRKELREIEADPSDLTEWIAVVILALDGAWRAGGTPKTIIDTIVAKQTKNENRVWPDWRTMPADKAIEHDRSHDASDSATASDKEGA